MKLFKSVTVVAVLFLMGACASRSDVAQTAERRVSPHPTILTGAKDAAQVQAALNTWEDRLGNLKKEANQSMSDDRYSFFKDKISKIESDLTDARDHFLKMRLAEGDDKQKHLNNVNDEFNDMVKIYDTRYAD